MTTYTLLSRLDVPNHLDTFTGPLINGVVFTVASPVTLTKVWFYSFAGSTALPAEVGVFAGSGPAEVFHDAAPSWSGAAGSGWVSCTTSQPLSAGTYTAAAWNGAAGGAEWYAITAAGWGPVTNGPLSAAANPDVFTEPATVWGCPATVYGAFNVFLDVEVADGGAASGTGTAVVALTASGTGSAARTGSGAAALALTARAAGSPARSGTGTAVVALTARSAGLIPGTAGERQLVRLAVAAFFGGTLVATDAGTCFQGGPLTGSGLGTAYPYTVRHAPDEYYTTGMPDGQDWGCVLSTTRLERNTRLDSYGGKYSGYWARRYTIECELALICELPHIEVAGAGLDDLIDAMEAMVFADRTLGTSDGSKGVLIIQAGPGRAGIRDVTPKFEALDEVKGRYAAEATVTFEALVMIAA